MIYRVEAFDIETEFLAFEEDLPDGSDDQLKVIMGWTSDQQGWEGYNLSQLQLSAIEGLIGKPIHDSNHYFQLTCNA
ncbi:hypothetical protein EI534_20720 [Pseudomonas frederiksbergensis]|uniref:DUF7683 domain-containing protein n=1 Tax=Gammaproteobacteria TaxID=1236 RepID=UPI001913F6DA|nr:MULTISPECIES: hypothetical protein [Gammaproteobacteria]MBK5300316.1 hypothetical protein [Bacillus sp. TH86]MBK5320085.1 hypothetical protein [Bacillus sp. TH59]MBK5335035.1 hypothetical protein [Bacillus sp. TH57]MCE6979757.1 hypothetical protein [Pseudomonas frederiksbergensis]MBK5309123.1 hypothetical protein [Pseudomonas sp. TH71]